MLAPLKIPPNEGGNLTKEILNEVPLRPFYE